MDGTKRNKENCFKAKYPPLRVRMPVLILVMAVLLSSCASSEHGIQARLNAMVMSKQSPQALSVLEKHENDYGHKNRLLFDLDKGMLAHAANHFELSISAFEEAKHIYDDLYTKSISQELGSWLINDYALDYRGDDYEYTMVYALQALNYAALGNIDEALVDIRAVDEAFKLISARYGTKQHNVYDDDAFIRLLSGILWQSSGTSQGYNDAFIDYSRAMRLYPNPPGILLDHFHQAKYFMDHGIDELSGKARIYIVEYTGFAPTKVSESIVIPLDRGTVTRVSIPRLKPSREIIMTSVITAKGINTYAKETELVQDIGRVAYKVLSARKGMIIAKAALRPLGKYALERAITQSIRRQYGDVSADIMTVMADVFNIATEVADCRSWATLPNHVRIGYFLVDPGEYEITIEDLDARRVVLERKSLGQVLVKKGDVRFLITRSSR